METSIGVVPIGEVLRARASQTPGRRFLFGMEREFTWTELDRMVDRFASALLERGLRKRDHMAIWMTNSPYWVVAFLACLRIGAVMVPLNTRYKVEEVRYILGQCDARILFMMDSFFGIDYHRLLLEMAPELARQHGSRVNIANLPQLQCIVNWGEHELSGAMPLSDFLGDFPGDRVSPLLRDAESAVQAADIAIIVYTSGTTGKPKGAMHSHEILRRVGYCAQRLRVRPDDVVLGHMPFYHVGGLFMQLVMSVSAAGGLALMPKWDPQRALELIVRDRVSQFGGTPTHFHDLIHASATRPQDTSCLRAAFIGGAVDMRGVITAAMRAFPTLKMIPSYGLTEGTVCATMNYWDDPIDVLAANKSPPLGDTRIKIVDTDTGLEVPAGQPGEILLAGSLIMKGYYNDEIGTRNAVTSDGWLRTGDIGVLDSAGYLSVTDRLKEMFKTGGTNAYPAEIEAHLNTMPKIAESVVLGVPDARLSEVGFAYVRLKEGCAATAEEVLAHCRGKIADYKVPRFIQFLDRFPMTETGKIERIALRKRAAEDMKKLRPLSGNTSTVAVAT